jgi:hypothetical protein
MRFEVHSNSVVAQWNFRTRFRKDPPHRNGMGIASARWVRKFEARGFLCGKKSLGRLQTP